MTGTVQTFRIDVVRLWCWAAIVHGLFMAFIVGVILLIGWRVNWVAVLSISLVPSLHWIVLGLRFRISVSPAGFTWMELDGRSNFATWDEIEGASRSGLLFFPLAQLELGKRGLGAVFLLLTDQTGFGDALREYAGPDHPLTRAVNGESGEVA